MNARSAASAPAKPIFPHLGDRYRVDALLGQGGMGEVFQCHDHRTGQTVALKCLKTDDSKRQATIAALFEREYYALRELAHPSIIEVFDYGISPDGGAYYTMELLDGQDLRTLAPVHWAEACALLRDVASSLAIMHSRRLLHRDVSPSNVHKNAAGRAKLLDFGAMATFGIEGQVIGTPPCIAPEMVHGQPLDARADLYSLGALGYFLVGGQHAYPARRLDVLRDLWRSRPRALSKLAPEVPEELCSLLTSMISLDAMARPTSAGEVIERLTAIAGLETDESLEESLQVARAYLKTPTLLGRNAPLGRLRKQALRAARGRGSACIVEGPPGIGRTRLLDALELEGRLAGATVLTTSAADNTGGSYGLIAKLARSLASQLPELARNHFEPHQNAIIRVLPELAQQLSLSEPSEVAPPHRMEDVDSVAMAAMADWIDSVAIERTLIIAADDLQDADEQSQGILSALAHRASQRRMAVVVSVTTGQQEPPLVAGLRRVAPAITLAPFDTEDTHKLVRSLFGDVPHAGLVANWVSRLAQGKPRDCMELCEHLVESGIAKYRRGTWVLPAALREEELPRSFEDALRERLQQLGPDALSIAQGIALTSLRLARREYGLLLSSGENSQARVFAAVSELVATGVLVGDGDEYRLAQPAYLDAIRSTLDDPGRRQIHRRLVVIFKARGNTYNVADHLVMAGDEAEAMAAVIGGYERSTQAWSSGAMDARSGTFGEAALAFETRRRLLDFWKEHKRPERERYILYRSIMMLSNSYDASVARPYLEPLVEMLKDALGLQHWNQLDEEATGPERIRHCLAEAKQAYDGADERDRVLEPSQAIPAAIVLVGIGQNTGRQNYDAPLLRYLLDFVEHLLPLSPRLATTRDAIEHSLALVTGRVGKAHDIRLRMLKYYETGALPSPDNPLYYVSQLGRAIILHAEGYFWAVRGGTRAETWAALLEDPLQGLPEEGNAVRRSGHIWLRRAWEIRRIMHLYNGSAKDARRTQDKIDQLAMQRGWAAFGGGTAQFEALAHAACGDLMALKQSVQALETIVDQGHEGWSPFLHIARGEYHRLRGAPEEAVKECQTAIELTGAGEHAAWSAANISMIEALLALGRAHEALETARRAVTDCKRVDLGPYAEHGLKRVLSLAEAATGSAETAIGRLERLRAAAEEGGVDGAIMGYLDETIARACIYANDPDGFRAAAARAGKKYRAGGNPALFAKHDRLLQAGSAAGFPTDSRAPTRHSPDLPIDGKGVQTELAALDNQQERHQAALRVMIERTGAKAGFLFLWEHDALRLGATNGQDEEPPTDLVDALAEYLKAELDEYPEVTVTCFDQRLADGKEPGFQHPEGNYQPVLLTASSDNGRQVVGIAALLDTGEDFHMPSLDMISSITEGLHWSQAGEAAVSVFELE